MQARVLTLLFLSLVLLNAVPAMAGDEQWINQQLETGYCKLEDGKTYTLTDSIILKSGCVLQGGTGSKITIPDHAGWQAWTPLVSGKGVQNCIIDNIFFDANADNNQDIADKTANGNAYGNGFYNCIHVIDCDNISVQNCQFINGLGDGFRAKTSTNIFFINNQAEKLGHDCFYAIDSQNVLAKDNILTTRTNSALRLWNCQHVRFFNNRITAQHDGKGGNPGIEIEYSKDMDNVDVEISNNIIYETWGSGVWALAYDAGAGSTQGIIFRDNLLSSPSINNNIPYGAGFTISGVRGTTITNNVFDNSYNAGVLVLEGGESTTIADNIITNTVPHAGIDQEGTGAGINDRVGAALNIIRNCLYANSAGDTYGCIGTETDNQDPKTHNTSSGWWWDSLIGAWASRGVPATDLGFVAPTLTNNTTDTDTHEIVFDDIFDIMKVKFADNSTVYNDPDKLENTVQEEDKNNIKGGIKIAAWNNLSYVDDQPYISSPNDAVVQVLAMKSPSASSFLGIYDSITKDFKIELQNGIATAVMDVTMKTYTEDNSTGKKKKHWKTSYATFSDSVPAPAIFQAPESVTCYVHVYTGLLSNYIEAAAEPEGLTGVTYECNGKASTHKFLLGERHTDRIGAVHTNYSHVDYWEGELPHNGNFVHLTNITNPAVLSIKAHSLYGDVPVKISIIEHDTNREPFYSWVFRFLSYLTLFVGFILYIIRIPFK